MFSFTRRISPSSVRNAPTKYFGPSPLTRSRVSLTLPATLSKSTTRLSQKLQTRQTHYCRAETKNASTPKDQAVYEFRRLVETAKYGIPPPEWFNKLEHQGEILSVYVDELRNTIAQKNNELGRIQERLTETTNILNDAKELQDATEAQLRVRTNEIELLKSEIAQMEQHRDADVTESMERYRELEDALANVENELRSQSESFHSKELSTPVDSARLAEIVKQQDNVFEQLKASLIEASEDRGRVEEAARKARAQREEIERTQSKLQQDQELLSKELSQLQILYAEKEMAWMQEMNDAQDDCARLKEEEAGLEVMIATKNRKLKTVTTSLDELQLNYNIAQTRLAELKRECAELQSVNDSFEQQLASKLADKPDHQSFTRLKSQLTRLQVRVPVLEEEINELKRQCQTAEAKYNDVEKELVRQERKSSQLEQRSTILQLSIEEKSNRLVATQKEKRVLKSDADRMQRESAALREQLTQSETELENLRDQLQKGQDERRDLHAEYQKEILTFAERHQEAQHVILYHQQHRNENRDLKSTIATLQAQIEQHKAEMHRIVQGNADEMEKIQSSLSAAHVTLREKDIELSTIQEERDRLQLRLSNLRESQEAAEEDRSAEFAELEKQLQDANGVAKRMESEIRGVQGEMTKLQNELVQRQRVITVRDQEIVTLKDDARLANERVEALRGQITSMQTLNREMEVEMAETDDTVSQMNTQIRELREGMEERQRRVNELSKTISDMEIKNKHSMEQFSSQIESLEEYSKQQEALVESFFEEKQGLQESMKDLKNSLEEETSKYEMSESKLKVARADCTDLKAKLAQAERDVTAAKESATLEVEQAAEILAKAESMAQTVHTNLEVDPDPELVNRIYELEQQLEAEQQSTADALARSAVLEADVTTLKKQLADGTPTADSATQNELITMSKRLSKSLAAEDAALTEIQRLRQHIKAIEAEQETHVGVHVMPTDQRLNDLRRHASDLEAENEKLRQAALKRNQILAQSRSFIEQYLSHSISTLPDLQP